MLLPRKYIPYRQLSGPSTGITPHMSTTLIRSNATLPSSYCDSMRLAIGCHSRCLAASSVFGVRYPAADPWPGPGMATSSRPMAMAGNKKSRPCTC
ncbi:hypothetical protein BKA67DRAFT_566140 [Truncatella angustata]|uniref:Uncharacterized protein n=1 Tax=Truncatella angustata TaxID=152316 RepID=A0A9P8UM33_9PEZI|nr:uncharacterized protein BKA67DRAFT_566140 [Truncatella angustata]KAH6654747.1 hypothetical protein BKA67DRAFT_566140 [Truncatella angustata]